MPIALPNLDERTWADLVDEGRALIPFYAPEWTDQNYSDPGITLLELLASVAEMDIFMLNRLTDRARLKFLALVGIHPEPPRPASTPLAFTLLSGDAIPIPAEVIFTGNDPLGVATPFRTLAPLNVVPANLAAVQIKDANGFRDLTDRWRRGIPFGIFGDTPAPGAELYLGFDRTLAAGVAFQLYLGMAGGRSGADERYRILAEAARAKQACTPQVPVCAGAPSKSQSAESDGTTAMPPFAGVRTIWEVLTAAGWIAIGGAAVSDDTRAFTLDGGIVIIPPADAPPQKLGRVEAPLAWLRVRFEAGSYDAPPVVQTLLMNAVAAEQSAPVTVTTWTIKAGVTTTAATTPPITTGLELQFDANGNLTALEFVPGTPAQFCILAFSAATATAPGSITVEGAVLGVGDGTPWQQFVLPQVPVKQCSLAMYSYEDGGWQIWNLRSDFDSSGPGDRHFELDATTGTVTFGNGRKGLAPPPGALFFARFLTTRADGGNIVAGTIGKLQDSPHNRAYLLKFDDVKGRLAVNNPIAAADGKAAETVGQAIGRAVVTLAKPQRAVTLEDFETLALETPGTVVARVKAWANQHPSFPCIEAPGMVTLVILPKMPGPRPTPSGAMRNAVASYLNRRRILGSRLEVVGPTYREVAVQAQVKTLAGASKTGVQQRVVDALNAFFDPLEGGPDGTGWPFGRDVYRIEVMQVIENVQGVDYVASFALLADGCTCAPQCGNVCLAPGWLVAAGQHEIEVI